MVTVFFFLSFRDHPLHCDVRNTACWSQHGRDALRDKRTLLCNECWQMGLHIFSNQEIVKEI